MEERDRMMIEKYLAQEMTPSERHEVEKRIQTDPQFRTEMEEYKLAVEALKIAQREELKNRFRERDKMLDKDNARTIHRGRNLWLLAAIVTGIILLTWVIYYGYRQPAEEAIYTSLDTIPPQHNIPVEDTVTHAVPDESPKEEEKEEKDTKPAKRDKSKELFAANFEPYMDETMDVAMRGDEEDLTALEKFQIDYAEKDFENVIKGFAELSSSQQENDNLRFMYANALMAVNKIDESISIMQNVMLNKKSIYHKEAAFYLALGYIAKGKYEEAKQILRSYTTDTEVEKKNKALILLEELK